MSVFNTSVFAEIAGSSIQKIKKTLNFFRLPIFQNKLYTRRNSILPGADLVIILTLID